MSVSLINCLTPVHKALHCLQIEANLNRFEHRLLGGIKINYYNLWYNDFVIDLRKECDYDLQFRL